MSWLAKLKEQVQEHTISAVFALIGLLSLIVWQAVPSEVWGKVSAAVPKRAIWALLGLSTIAAILECAYIFVLRRELAQKLTARFGVMWSKDLVAHCPSCLSPLTSYGQYSTAYGFGSTWGFRCVKCGGGGQLVVMSDDAGRVLELQEAKQLIRSNATQKPTVEYVIDDVREKILTRLIGQESGMTADQLTGRLGLSADRASYILNEMEERGYLTVYRSMLGTGSPDNYRLDKKGTEFLMRKGII